MLLRFFRKKLEPLIEDISIDWPSEEDPKRLSTILTDQYSCPEVYIKRHLIHKAFEKRSEIATITAKDFIVFKAYPDVFSKIAVDLNGSFKLQPDLKTLICKEFQIKLELAVKPTTPR